MPATPLSVSLSHVGDRVWFAHSPLTNWAIVRTPAGIVLVDAGYAGHADSVIETVRTVADGASHPRLAAILVTHAHTDHIGGIPAVLDEFPDARVLAASAEVPAVRGPEREQITIGRMGWNLLRPKFVNWLRAGVSAGGLRETTIPSAEPFTVDYLTSFGIRAHPAPGHTIGSTAYEVVGSDVLITGDAYVTDHLSYRSPRAGAIAPLFSADPVEASRTADSLPHFATLLPGHGPARSSPPGR